MRNADRIKEYINDGCNNRKRIGLELEHFVCDASYQIIPYEVMSECLKELSRRIRGEDYMENGEILAIKTDNYMVSIEPGCQIEISILPKKNLSSIREIYGKFRKVCDAVFGKRGYYLLEKGVFPLIENGEMKVEDMPLIPKERYRLMDEYFLNTGKYGRHMMRATASTQVSIDFSSEADAMKKMRVFQKLSPILSLLTENKSNMGTCEEMRGHILRTAIWNDVDKVRCGYFENSAGGRYSFKQYAEYVYNNPCILYQRDGEVTSLGQKSARDYLGRKKIDEIGHVLSMFFPMVRLKQYLELRFADSMPIDKAISYAALIKTIAYNKKILDAIDKALSDVKDVKEIYDAERSIMSDGYNAVVYKKDVREWLVYLFDLVMSEESNDAALACELITSPVLHYRYKSIVCGKEPEHVESARKIRTYLSESTAKYHNRVVRTLYVPKIFTKHDTDVFRELTDTLYGIFDKVTEEYFANPDYRKLFGFSDELNRIILREQNNRYKCNIPMARIDIFYDEQTKDFKFCEFNTDGSSAMNEDRELNLAFKNSKAFREFEKEYNVSSLELFDTWADEAIKIYREWSNDSEAVPRVVIADFMEYATINEFLVFRGSFEKRGCKVTVCDIRELRWDGRFCTAPSEKLIDLIYRRAVTSDIMANYKDVRGFINAVESGMVCLVGDFRTQIVHNKILFKILHMPETMRLLTKKEQLFVKAHVPVTVSLSEKLNEDNPELMSDVFHNKDRWIIKPEDSYGSKGVYAGVEYSDASKWKAMVESCRDKGYILQEFVSPYRLDNIDLLCDSPKWVSTANLTGLFVYNGKFSGVYSRISYDKMISTQYNEMALPTIIAEIRKGNN